MKRPRICIGNSARGRLLLLAGAVAAFSPIVVHFMWLARGGVLSPLTVGWFVRAAIWPALLALAFTSVWRGSQQNMRLLGWTFLCGSIAAAVVGVAPLKKPFPAPVWPSFFGWAVTASVLLLSKDVAGFVHEQRSKKKA